MKKLSVENGIIFLDGEKVENVKSYNLASSAKNPGIAELTLVIDVSMIRIEPESKKQ